MDIVISPGKLHGKMQAIASKSHAHRLLICAAFADSQTSIICQQTNQDIEATVDCLRSLGACIKRTDNGFLVTPANVIPSAATLNCCESGSTLRFMLPIVGALGVDTTFLMEGRLPQRPLSPLWEEMERMGCTLTRPTENTLRCQGKLNGGTFKISGNVSSQFITGLLFAGVLMEQETAIEIIGKLESKPYVALTQQALAQFGVHSTDYHIARNSRFRSPVQVQVEGDWSNAAFFLTANTLGSQIEIDNLNPDSVQGDKAIVSVLRKMGSHVTIDAADIPDLVPILSVASACLHGAVFTNIQRLRIKESDRVASVIDLLKALGCDARANENTMTVLPCRFTGGTVDARGDHRIAMAAAIAATEANGPITILGAHCVAKSYPAFWQDYKRLRGNYEQHIR